MMLRKSLSVLSLIALSLFAAACGRHARQHRDFRMMMMSRQGGMHGMRRMHRGMGDPVAQLLDHQAALRLTAAQVNSLISIDEKLKTDNTPLRDRLMALRPPRGAKADSSNPAARTPQRDSAATIMQQMRENRWRAMNSAYAQLTEEQMGMVANRGGGPAGPGGFRGGRGGTGMRGGGGQAPGQMGGGKMRGSGGGGGGGGGAGNPPSGDQQ
jgi:LTXXQ motif family protein